ncbi:hypothetical protein Leryth_007459, partial [Lithospermum erythrorhizon]
DTDISDSEIEEYEEKSYEELKSGKRRVKINAEAYTCPYCPKKRKRDYMYKDLLQLTWQWAGMKYLEQDVTAIAGASQPGAEEDPLADQDRDEMFIMAMGWVW